MTEQINELLDEIIAGVSNISASLGLNRVAGQLYILLFLSERPLSLDEMTERLKVSKGHVSTNIRALERWQAVRKIWVKGSRKDYYQANTDTIKIVKNQLTLGIRQRSEDLEKIITKAKDRISQISDGQPKEKIKNLEEKLKKIEKMYKQVNSLLTKLELVSVFK